MFGKLELTRMAQTLAAHAGARLGLIAQNVANADTPGYKARDLADFAEIWRQDGQMRHTRPGHLEAGSTGREAIAVERSAPSNASPDGNTVSLEHEMVAAAEVRQSHEMALAIYRSTSEIVRTSLGRSR